MRCCGIVREVERGGLSRYPYCMQIFETLEELHQVTFDLWFSEKDCWIFQKS
jgi:hypothetical protein